MKQNTDLTSSDQDQGSIASFDENDSNSTSWHDYLATIFSSTHGTKRKNSESIETNFEPEQKRSNEIKESCSSNSEDLLRQLKKANAIINALQDKINEKDEQLSRKQTECEEKSNNLRVYFDLIRKLKKECNEKTKQLEEKESTIIQLKAKCTENDEDQLQETSSKLNDLETSMNSYFSTLFNRAENYKAQKQHMKAILTYGNAIEFEKITQNRSDKLAMLFVRKSFCYFYLKLYTRTIDATNLALKHNSNFKPALYNRSIAYFELRQYENARQSLKELLRLDPDYEKAKELLERVQECINSSN